MVNVTTAADRAADDRPADGALMRGSIAGASGEASQRTAAPTDRHRAICAEQDLRRPGDGRCRSNRGTPRRRLRLRWPRDRPGGAAGGRVSRASRSTRRSALDPAGARSASRPPPSRPSTGRSERCQCEDRVAGAVQRRTDQLGHAASRTTWRPARSRTWRTRATSHPLGRPGRDRGSTASRCGRRSSGDPLEQRPELAREALRARGWFADRIPPGSRHPESTVSTSRSTRATGPRAPAPCGRVAPRVDRAELRADVEVDATLAGAAHPGRRRHRWRRRSPSRSCRTSCRRRHGRPRSVSGATSGLSRYRTSSLGARAASASSASAAASSGDSIAIQRSGWPCRCGTRRGPKIRRRLADRPRASCARSGRRRARLRPTRRGTPTFAPKPFEATAAITAGTSLALTE
jgi:hypothetical protein